MTKASPLVSIVIVDYKNDNPYLIECLNAIQKQTYKNFETILITDYKNNLKYPGLKKKSYGHYIGPAEKRDEGAKLAKGDILAFIDDDAYPSPRWLEKMVKHFQDQSVAGVGGPGVTPPGVSWQEEASGWASASFVGAGPYTYRFLPEKRRAVDDYPSMNLAVRKTDFEKVGGFDSNFWPGEDTKLCLDITHKLDKQIIYDPKVLVYHHRRPLWKGHLRQNGNFGLHRGFFARILPQTSLKPIYFMPSLLLLGCLFLLFYSVIAFLNQNIAGSLSFINIIGLYCLAFYFIVLCVNGTWIFRQSKKASQAGLSIPVIFITHLWYGARFLQGFLFTRSLPR
jgi:GT2 family glycosyltransferase